MLYQPSSWTDPLPLHDMFPEEHPLQVDMGCGKGRFLISRARKTPTVNYIGIDRQKKRLLKVQKKARDEGLQNVRLLQVEASYAATYLIPPGTVSVMYILFPDPWPKRRHQRRRLFNEPFLDSLHAILQPGGIVHTATDNLDYAESINRIFSEDSRFAPATPLELPEEEWSNFEVTFRALDAEIGRNSFQRV